MQKLIFLKSLFQLLITLQLFITEGFMPGNLVRQQYLCTTNKSAFTFFSSIEEQEQQQQEDESSSVSNDSNINEELSTSNTARNKDVKCPDCELCDGSGRIAGGLGAVLPWLPIKAYRPCPNFIDKGGQYTRVGQGLNEIAFGRDSTFREE